MNAVFLLFPEYYLLFPTPKEIIPPLRVTTVDMQWDLSQGEEEKNSHMSRQELISLIPTNGKDKSGAW